jgi:hypothetical protein
MTHDLRTARDRIRAKAHRALAAKRRRRAAIRGGLALSIVAAVGLTAWRLPAPPTPTPVETPDSGALSVQIVAFDPEPIERISDDDLARISEPQAPRTGSSSPTPALASSRTASRGSEHLGPDRLRTPV